MNIFSWAAKKEAKKTARRGCEFPARAFTKRAQNKTRILRFIRFVNIRSGTASNGK